MAPAPSSPPESTTPLLVLHSFSVCSLTTTIWHWGLTTAKRSAGHPQDNPSPCPDPYNHRVYSVPGEGQRSLNGPKGRGHVCGFSAEGMTGSAGSEMGLEAEGSKESVRRGRAPLPFPGCGILELLDTSLDQEEVGKKCQRLSSSPTSPQNSPPPPASATLEKH